MAQVSATDDTDSAHSRQPALSSSSLPPSLTVHAQAGREHAHAPELIDRAYEGRDVSSLFLLWRTQAPLGSFPTTGAPIPSSAARVTAGSAAGRARGET